MYFNNAPSKILFKRSHNNNLTFNLNKNLMENKLKFMIIFRAKEGKKIENQLKMNPYVQSGRIFVSSQVNAWNDEIVMLKWVNNIWNPYILFFPNNM